MFDSVIVGVDGGRGRDAIVLARALTTGRLALVSAYPGARSAPSVLAQRYFDALGQDAERALEEARRDAGLDAAAELLAVPDQSPARALHDVAVQRGADLIVISSAHHGPLGRLLAGDVGRGVLQAAPCPVAVAPRGFDGRRDQLRRIAVGFDDSAEAHAALDLAAALAHETGATLAVYCAWDIPAAIYAGTAYAIDVGPLAEEERLRATAAAERALEALPEAERHVVRGTPRQVLTEATQDADLLVVGSRRWGPARRIAVGSTSDHLVHHARCPVIVVPRPARAPGASRHGTARTAARA